MKIAIPIFLALAILGCSSPSPEVPKETCLGKYGDFCRFSWSDRQCLGSPFVYAYYHQNTSSRTGAELADEFAGILASGDCVEKKLAGMDSLLCCRIP